MLVSLVLSDGKCFDWISIPVSDWVEFNMFILAWISSFLRHKRFDAYYICDCYGFYFHVFGIYLFVCFNLMQIKREISIMKLVRHPYVVRLHEVCDILLAVDHVSYSLLKGD
jgi:hypothetical protein